MVELELHNVLINREAPDDPRHRAPFPSDAVREQLTPKQRRGLMHERCVLLKRARNLNDQGRLLLDGWTKNYPELSAAYRLKEGFYGIYEGQVARRPPSRPTRRGTWPWCPKCGMPDSSNTAKYG